MHYYQSRLYSALLFCPLLIANYLLLISSANAVRNKEIDEDYHRLIPLDQIPASCEHARGVEPGTVVGDPAKEYGFVEGAGLEKCRVWLDEESSSASDEVGHYERYKCKHLRGAQFSRIFVQIKNPSDLVHGHYNEERGKCECKDRWKGPTCNE